MRGLAWLGTLGLLCAAVAMIGLGVSASSQEAPPARGGDSHPNGELALLDSLRVHYMADVPEDFSLIANFKFPPDDEEWMLRINPGKVVTLEPGNDPNAAFLLTMTRETLRAVYHGEVSASTALLPAPGDSPSIRFQPLAGFARLPEYREAMMEFVQRFFNPTQPEKLIFDEAHSRPVQGTNVVAMYNADGLRSSWHMVKPGEHRLQEPGTAYPQAIIFLTGHGQARIGNVTIPVKSGESYYVAPGSEREIWSEDEPLTFIRIAWGKGA